MYKTHFLIKGLSFNLRQGYYKIRKSGKVRKNLKNYKSQEKSEEIWGFLKKSQEI